MNRPEKMEKTIFGKSFKKHIFLEAVYQLKKKSDYSQNDPPGPEQKLEKKIQKKCIFSPPGGALWAVRPLK